MKFVEIYKTQNDGSQRAIVVCKLIGEKAVCEGDKNLIENLEHKGISDFSVDPPVNLFPKDGIYFLEKLRFTFASGYLNASKVKSK